MIPLSRTERTVFFTERHGTPTKRETLRGKAKAVNARATFAVLCAWQTLHLETFDHEPDFALW